MRLAAITAIFMLTTLQFPLTGKSQTVLQDWAARYTSNGPFPYGPAGMVTDASGNVYILGTAHQFTANADFLTLKYNSSGVLQWAVTYNGPGNNDDEAAAIALDNSGNILITGHSVVVSNDTTGDVMSTVKYNPAGTRLWATTTKVGWVSNDPSAIAVDAAGNVYVIGSEVNAPYAYDFLTVKINANGVQQWTATYNGTANGLDFGYAIAVDAAGNVYVTGESKGQSIIVTRGSGIIDRIQIINQGSDYVTIKYNSAGVAVWTNRYNGAGNTVDVPSSLALDAAANVYVTGASGGSALTVSYTTDGVQQWTAQNSIATNNSKIAIDPSGNVVTAGYFVDGVTISYLVEKYTPTGDISWIADYYGSAYETTSGSPGVALAVDQQSNIYIAGLVGTTANDQTSSYNYATVKYASTGTQDWAVIYNGPANSTDVPTAICLSHSSAIYTFEPPDVFVTGIADISQTPQNVGNYTTLKYSQAPTILAQLSVQTTPLTNGNLGAAAKAGLSNYPNPFRGVTNITYTLAGDSHVTLQVFDQAGKTIATLVNENESAGVHSLPFSSARLATGIYHYKIVASSGQGSFTDTKQMLVQ